MKYLVILLVSILIIQESIAPPVDKKEKKDEEENRDGNTAEILEYHRYLQEVVQALESDPAFRKKLEAANESEIRDGTIAHELEFVGHRIRNKLDELKRIEIERLKHLATREFELENGLDVNHLKIAEHLDDTNPHTFEINDLKKLIAKTTKDIDEADRKRREEFKEYEMNKKFEQEEKMKKMNDDEKKKFENDLHEMEVKHKDHEKLHHPGSKKQLEEVWEKQDHMENQEFDPRTFFFLHDLDGNGVWDPNELKTLFLKELDKLYAAGHPEDDLNERVEEMERMREHVIKSVDLNQDGLISYDEFLQETKKPEFEKDPGWESLDEQQLYSEQEYEEYRRLKAQQLEQAISKAMSEENHSAGHPQAGQQFPPHRNQVPHQQPQYQVPQQQHYPQQGLYQVPVPQGQYNQVPQQGQHQVPVQQGQYNQIPQQQQQFNPNQQAPSVNNINQVPQQNQQIPVGQAPVQQQYQQVPVPNQVPQQQYQQVPVANQVPQQQYQQVLVANQVPQQQYQQVPVANQVPQQQYQHVPVANQVPQQQQYQQAQQNQVPAQQAQQNAGVNQLNTQNQVPAANNAQSQESAPQAVKT